MTQPTTIPARSEIPAQYCWNAESVYPTPQDWEIAFDNLTAQIPAIAQWQGTLHQSPQRLADYLDFEERLLRDLNQLFVYANMAYAVETTDPQAAARAGRVRGLFARVNAATAFTEPELMQIGLPTLRQWITQEARLSHLGHYLDRLEDRQAHIRSAEVEELLGQVRDPFGVASSIHGILGDTDLKFAPARDEQGNDYEIGQGNIGALVTHPDRTVRQTAWQNYADGYRSLQHGMAACLAAGLKQDVFMARARRYNSCLEAALAPQRLPLEVFYNLIEVFRENLPTWHRYWALRQRALNLESFHEWDVKAPLAQKKIEIPYEQAVEWICEGMVPLGEAYVATMRKGLLEERWVDVYPNKGKRSGAFSTGSYDSHPFIMMSYNDDIFSLSTLAHELGHSMHSLMSKRAQRFIYARYSLFAAEVASNFNQALVRKYLLETQTDRDFQIAVLEEAMSNYHRYFFIMPTLARFELEMHERAERGEALTAQIFNQRMADLFAEAYGPNVAIDRERTGITWAQFSTHLYMNFYVYQYATGIAGANALMERVVRDGEAAAEDYRSFLRAGGSQYPLDALAAAGVDLASPQPVRAAFNLLGEYVSRLEQLLA